MNRAGTWWFADLCPPGAAESTMCPVRAVLDSGFDITSLSERVAQKLKAWISSIISVKHPMEGAHHARAADGSLGPTTRTTCQLRVALNTEWGPGAWSHSVFP